MTNTRLTPAQVTGAPNAGVLARAPLSLCSQTPARGIVIAILNQCRHNRSPRKQGTTPALGEGGGVFAGGRGVTGDTNQRERSESEMLVSSWKRLRVPEHAQQCVCVGLIYG